MNTLLSNYNPLIQITFLFLVALILIVPLGRYIAKVYNNQFVWLEHLLGPIEDYLYEFAKINPLNEMTWSEYAKAVLYASLGGFLLLYALLRLQAFLPLNPNHLPNVDPILAFNITASFLTNTNFQSYVPEGTLSILSQMLGLTVQNFLSASMGMAVASALIRSLYRKKAKTVGNFWVDWLRGNLYILLPLSIIWALLLGSQGVIQNFHENTPINPYSQTQKEQFIPGGPVASQVAIKQLGSNGGGYFNANSAHPFENPTAFSNFISLMGIILIPMALFYTFGIMINDKRQGWSLIIASMLIFIPMLFFSFYYESQPNPFLRQADFQDLNVQQGNLEGKELRFGITNSVLWSSLTTATSNGSTNAALDSYSPMGSFIPLMFMLFGEVVFGGVGAGLYGILIYVLIAVFITGLMSGRTPEYLGKKIQSYEVKMLSLALFLPLIYILFSASLAILLPVGQAAILNVGPHGITEVLYNITSATMNNGSAFGGLDTSSDFYRILTGIAMLVGRYWVIIPILGLAGAMVKKNATPAAVEQLSTCSPLFIIILVVIIALFAYLSYLPILFLGPLSDHFLLP